MTRRIRRTISPQPYRWSAPRHVRRQLADLERENRRLRSLLDTNQVELITRLQNEIAGYRRLAYTSDHARLNTLLAISSALLVTHDIDSILQRIVEDTVPLFPGTAGVLLYLEEPGSEALVLRATSTGYVPTVRLVPGQAVAGRAYVAPRAMLMTGPELEFAMAELDPEHYAALRTLLSEWPPHSALLAPLRIEAQRIGALVLFGGTHAHLYHPRDLPFIQALADLAAVAIGESYQRARAAALQQDLRETRSAHAEAQARLSATQAQLLQSAKLAAVGELAASVAHEINNPLYAARNSLYLVEQELPADAPQRPFLDIAQGELARIARIITRMRDFYRPARAELEPTSVNDILVETIDLVQIHLRHGQVTVAPRLAGQLPLLTAHTDQLRQVFLNLMLNACDAMPDGGTLTITTAFEPGINGTPGMIVISIADTGTGIADEHMAHLFEPFYTTKPQGTGLGLAISAHIVTQHNGDISVESAAGRGSCFTIRLPAPEPPA